MKGNLLVLFIFFYSALLSQWLGSFEGSLNGDIVKVNITSQSNSKIVGEMFDSQQKFNIKGDLKGNKMTGEAVEQSLGLKFTLLGELKGDNSINFNLIINILGLKSETPFTVTKLNTSSTTKSSSNTTSKSSSNATSSNRDARVVGRWTKNESYNSGYGDNFMGSNFSQSIIFLADGGLADGGSNASISGSNYSGRSSGSGASQPIAGVAWFTKDSQIFISLTQDGKTQTESLGKYYIEGNKMLITQANGSKVLLTK